MSEFSQNIETGEIRQDMRDYQTYFTGLLHMLDDNADRIWAPSKHAASLRESLPPVNREELAETTQFMNEFYKKQWEGRDNSSFGPLTSTVAEVVWRGTKEELQLADSFIDGEYEMVWKPKFLTGIVTGSNPKDVATWHYDIIWSSAQKRWKYPYVSIQYNTDWVDWNKFKSPVYQNYPIETIMLETDNALKPWKLPDIEPQAVQLMKSFVQRGKLMELRSHQDAVAAAIGGLSSSLMENIGIDEKHNEPMTIEDLLTGKRRIR